LGLILLEADIIELVLSFSETVKLVASLVTTAKLELTSFRPFVFFLI